MWPLDRPDGMPSITSLEVMCGKDHMDVHLSFSQPFEGIVSSKGQHGDQRCIYVQPSSKKTFYTFRIAYSRCGTKPDLNGQFYENTVSDKELVDCLNLPLTDIPPNNSRWSCNTTRICWRCGTRRNDCAASGSTTTRRLPRNLRWSSRTWTSFNWTSVAITSIAGWRSSTEKDPGHRQSAESFPWAVH